MSARSGWVIGLQRLAQPDARPGGGAGSAGPRCVTGSSRASTLRMMSMYSRVRASGLANDWPYQPSTTCGPDTPSPSTNRPPDRWSIVSAAMAVAVGVRADSWMRSVPSRSFVVVRRPTTPAA